MGNRDPHGSFAPLESYPESDDLVESTRLDDLLDRHPLRRARIYCRKQGISPEIVQHRAIQDTSLMAVVAAVTASSALEISSGALWLPGPLSCF